MADLTALIERLENADGPSRELDARIHAAVFPKTRFMTYGGDTRTKAPATYDDIGNFDFDKWAEVGDTVDWDALAHMFGASERYSASIDSAVALAERVLPGVELEITNLYNVARVTLHHETGPFYGSSEINSIPIAICLSVLRALSAQEGSTDA